MYNCPRSNICAFDNPKAPHWFKYTACPNEEVCGPKHIYPDYNGDKLTIEVDYRSYLFTLHDICSYIIHAPEHMQREDILFMSVDRISESKMYVAKGKRYKWFKHLDRFAENGMLFDTRMGWQFYVVVNAETIRRGTFRLQIWV